MSATCWACKGTHASIDEYRGCHGLPRVKSGSGTAGQTQPTKALASRRRGRLPTTATTAVATGSRSSGAFAGGRYGTRAPDRVVGPVRFCGSCDRPEDNCAC